MVLQLSPSGSDARVQGTKYRQFLSIQLFVCANCAYLGMSAGVTDLLFVSGVGRFIIISALVLRRKMLSVSVPLSGIMACFVQVFDCHHF